MVAKEANFGSSKNYGLHYRSSLFLKWCFKFWCVVCLNNLIRAYWRCSVLRSMSTTCSTCIVGRTPTLGNERPRCAPNAEWTIWQHHDDERASGLVSTSLPVPILNVDVGLITGFLTWNSLVSRLHLIECELFTGTPNYLLPNIGVWTTMFG